MACGMPLPCLWLMSWEWPGQRQRQQRNLTLPSHINACACYLPGSFFLQTQKELYMIHSSTNFKVYIYISFIMKLSFYKFKLTLMQWINWSPPKKKKLRITKIMFTLSNSNCIPVLPQESNKKGKFPFFQIVHVHPSQ